MSNWCLHEITGYTFFVTYAVKAGHPADQPGSSLLLLLFVFSGCTVFLQYQFFITIQHPQHSGRFASLIVGVQRSTLRFGRCQTDVHWTSSTAPRLVRPEITAKTIQKTSSLPDFHSDFRGAE